MSNFDVYREKMTHCIHGFKVASVILVLLSFFVCFSISSPVKAYAEIHSDFEPSLELPTPYQLEDFSVPVYSYSAPSDLNAQHAVLMHKDNTLLYEKAAYDTVQIASITKIMTALIVLDSGIPLETPIVVSANAASIGESSAKLIENDVLSLKDALTALMVSSGNDAAQAIAESLGWQFLNSDNDESYNAFVNMLNEKAAQIGMKSTYFENPHGLDFESFEGSLHSTAYDVALMADYAMQNETFREIVSQQSVPIKVLRNGTYIEINLNSTNTLLGTYDGVCGIKTGFTKLAGYSFCGACERSGDMVYAIVLGCEDKDSRFEDTKTLFDWYYSTKQSVSLVNSPMAVEVNKDGSVITNVVVAEQPHKDWINVSVPLTVLEEPFCEVQLARGSIQQEYQFDEISGPISAGDKLGTLTFKQAGTIIAQYSLVSCIDVPEPSFFESIKIWFMRFYLSFSGEDGILPALTYNEIPQIELI